MLVAAAGALLLAGPAAAKEPCWKTLIDDWYDGRIDNVYPVACYRAALEHMPEDVAQYSTPRRRHQPRAAGGDRRQGPSDGGSNGNSSALRQLGREGRDELARRPTRARSTAARRRSSKARCSPRPDVTRRRAGRQRARFHRPRQTRTRCPCRSSCSAGLSIVLLTLGAAGFVARRVQTRRAAVGPRTDAERRSVRRKLYASRSARFATLRGRVGDIGLTRCPGGTIWRP